MNGNPYFYTRNSKGLNFISTQPLNSQKLSELKKELDVVLQKYTSRDFIINVIHCDSEFDKPALKDKYPAMNFWTCARGEHVVVIERSTRTIEDRGRSTCDSLPCR